MRKEMPLHVPPIVERDWRLRTPQFCVQSTWPNWVTSSNWPLYSHSYNTSDLICCF